MESKKTRLKRTPRITTKTITAASLLKKIKAVVLEEPQRADLGWWVHTFNGKSFSGRYTACQSACGTVACLAGWGAILLRPAYTKRLSILLSTYSPAIMREALGSIVDSGERLALFSCQPQFRFAEEYMPQAGTQEHADLIARRIDLVLGRHPELAKRRLNVKRLQRVFRSE